MNCCREFTIGIAPGPSCGPSTNWDSPGSCRLQVQGYTNSTFPGCGGLPELSDFGWDGKFPNYSSGQFTFTNTIPWPGGSGANVELVARVYKSGGNWRCSIVCSRVDLSGGQTFYDAFVSSGSDPLGPYGAYFGCGGFVSCTMEVMV